MARIGVVALLIIILACVSPALAYSLAERANTDLVNDALLLPDGATTTLKNVLVEYVLGDYAFIRDTFITGARPVLPAYMKCYLVDRGWSINVSGRMATGSDGRRVLVATDVSVYMCEWGGKLSPSPPAPFLGDGWPYIEPADTKVSTSSMTAMDEETLPPIPEPAQGEPSALLSAPAGSIAAAKLEGSSVDLEGKVVTAVFYLPDYSAIDFIYIQEPNCPSGIKVVPPTGTVVNTRDVVTLVGTVSVDQATGECQIIAASITKTGTAAMPKPMGMNNRSTAGGPFGLQPALYPTPEAPGCGLNATGTRTRVWGKWLSTVTEDNRKVCYIDDGSGLSRSGSQGLKVIYYHGDPPPIPAGGMLAITGILGVEKDGVNPVPVLRVEPYRVGFLYNLCLNQYLSYIGNGIDDYLIDIDDEFADVVYHRISSIQSEMNASYSVVFIGAPTRSLFASELNTLSTLVQSGREKRVVLIGEYNRTDSQYRVYNQRLNDAAAGIGMYSRFSTGTGVYDSGEDRDRLCPVNQNHYLTTNVTNLWDAGTDTFASGWESHARPLAYIFEHPEWPWIIEEDLATAGSRIAIHDSNILCDNYNNDYDTIPDKNFRFIYNICAIFAQ